MEWKDLLSASGLVIAFGSIIFQIFLYNVKFRDDMNKMNEDTNEKIAAACLSIQKDMSLILSRLTNLEVKTDLFWRCIENKVVNTLKSFPTHLDKDILLDKLLERVLTIQEAETLRTILDCEMKNNVEQSFAYVLILARVEQIIYDLRNGVNNGQGAIIATR